MRRVFWATMSFIGGSFLTVSVVVFVHFRGWLLVFPPGETKVEALSLLLTAATLIITAVALLIAVGAVVGYAFIHEAVTKIAEKTAEEVAKKTVQPILTRDGSAPIALSDVDKTDELVNALASGDGK